MSTLLKSSSYALSMLPSHAMSILTGWFKYQPWKKKSRISALNTRSILLTDQKKVLREESKSKTRRLRKVHFHLPKNVNYRRLVAQALDPKSVPIRRWQSIMLAPLWYETWAFPFRLALGSPSISSKIFVADILCDIFFFCDILVSLCTAPAQEVGAPPASFASIARRYFATTFPLQFLPCMLYWAATPVCAAQLLLLCPDTPLSGAGRSIPDGGGALSSAWAYGGDGGAAAAQGGAGVGRWDCIVSRSRDWPVWLWWASTVPRLAPRALRLARYLRAIENDLVPTRPHTLPSPR